MSEIHYNVEAVGEFCSKLVMLREHLEERLGDERAIYETVFDVWRDDKAETCRSSLDQLTVQVNGVASELEELRSALQRQAAVAREFLDQQAGW